MEGEPRVVDACLCLLFSPQRLRRRNPVPDIAGESSVGLKFMRHVGDPVQLGAAERHRSLVHISLRQHGAQKSSHRTRQTERRRGRVGLTPR